MGTNRLRNSKSAYLLQHQHNPVDWWPWGDEAFAEAARRDVPVFVSIGYSACHWCHVMAHESFEDEAVAKMLRENFVSIKVDREEHPDVDGVYLEAVQAMVGHGGWPRTVFLTPERLPFWGGTYFPPHEGTNIPSFTRVLNEISRAWANSREEIESQAESLRRSIVARTSIPALDGEPDIDTDGIAAGFAAGVLANFDPEWGGLGRAPKFLQPHVWMAMLDSYLLHNSSEALDAIEVTLDAVLAGGIYDHLAGGFARYSTDAFWMVPHFEKMLYDQALNARLYLRAYLVTRKGDYLIAASETIDFVLREMQNGEGLFAASLDADSSGEEGIYYTFRKEEIEALLEADAAAEFIEFYGVTKAGNFEARNILHRPLRGAMSRSETLNTSRAILANYRAQREAPSLDTKAVVEWNAMFVATLAEAGFHLNRDDYRIRAVEAFELLYQRANFANGAFRLAEAEPGPARAPAVLADYAEMLAAALALAQFSGESRFLAYAQELSAAINAEFASPDSPGFTTTAKSSPHLIANAADIFDSAYPSANSVVARAFFDLSVLRDSQGAHQAAMALLGALAETITKHPSAFATFVSMIAVIDAGPLQLVVPGRATEFLEVVRGNYLPNLYLLYGQGGDSPLWRDRSEGYAYLCRGFECLVPATSPEELQAQLRSTSAWPSR